jgi:hypothetical protein
MKYKEIEKLSACFASTVVGHLREFSVKLPKQTDVEPAPATFPEEALQNLYRISMVKSLCSLVVAEPPSE